MQAEAEPSGEEVRDWEKDVARSGNESHECTDRIPASLLKRYNEKRFSRAYIMGIGQRGGKVTRRRSRKSP